MKKAMVTLLVVLMAVSAVCAASFEIKASQGFLKSDATDKAIKGWEITTITGAVNLGPAEIGVSGSTTFPYAFFANAFTKGQTWKTKWANTADQTKTYWGASVYGTCDVVKADQIDLNLGAAVSYRYSNELDLNVEKGKHVVTLDAKADVTFWLAKHVGVFAGVEVPVIAGVKIGSAKMTFEYPNSLEECKKIGSVAATTAKAGLTVKL